MRCVCLTCQARCWHCLQSAIVFTKKDTSLNVSTSVLNKTLVQHGGCNKDYNRIVNLLAFAAWLCNWSSHLLLELEAMHMKARLNYHMADMTTHLLLRRVACVCGGEGSLVGVLS